jgi:D-arabinose 1-dehydrogenase-like Zn-dependent alcohol dehydrogenase
MATTRVAIAPMKAAQIPKPGADFEIVEREVPQPTAGQVRIKVQACGVCHSDVFTKEGWWPGIQYPRVPGHEVAGVVDEIGAGVTEWKEGAARGRGLARRPGQHVSRVPAGRFSQLPQPENSGNQL